MDELNKLKHLQNMLRVKNKCYSDWLKEEPSPKADELLARYRRLHKLYQEACIHYVEMKMEVGNV